jgi:acyl-CoA thioester hydrolase
VTARVTRARLRLAAGGEAFSAYARLLEEAATLASADAGYPTSWYARENTAWVTRRSTIDCVAPLPRAVDLEIVTWVADSRRVRSRREYEVYVPPETVSALTAHTDWVYVDRASGRPRRIPDAMMSAFVPDGAPPACARFATTSNTSPRQGKAIGCFAGAGQSVLGTRASKSPSRFYSQGEICSPARGAFGARAIERRTPRGIQARVR